MWRLVYFCGLSIIACLNLRLGGLELILTPPKINFANFLSCLVYRNQNQFLSLELILGKVKKIYFLSESLLEELRNMNHFTSKSIPTKSIL